MATTKTPYLVGKDGRQRADGSREVRWFWQPAAALRAKGWRSERLRRPDGTAIVAEGEAIDAAKARNAEVARWRAGLLLAAVAPPRERTLDDLITDYKATSPRYKRLADKTRKDYGWRLKQLSLWGGGESVIAIDATTVQELYWPLQEVAPTKANALVTMLRTVMEHGVKSRDFPIVVNPAAKPGMVAPEPRIGIWSAAAIAHFVSVADALDRHSIGDAVLVNEWFGQRQGDVLRLPRSVYRTGAISFRQSKTSGFVHLPIDLVSHCRDRLAEAAERNKRFENSATTIIVDENTGRPWNQTSFQHEFARIRAVAAAGDAAAGIPAMPEIFQPHDPETPVPFKKMWFMWLRHTAVVRLFEAGATFGQIAAITGHTKKSLPSIIERYYVGTRKMAEGAIRKRLAMEEE